MVKEVVQAIRVPSASQQERELTEIMKMPKDQVARVTVEYSGTSLTVPIPSEKIMTVLQAIGITNRTILTAKGWKVGIDIAK